MNTLDVLNIWSRTEVVISVLASDFSVKQTQNVNLGPWIVIWADVLLCSAVLCLISCTHWKIDPIKLLQLNPKAIYNLISLPFTSISCSFQESIILDTIAYYMYVAYVIIHRYILLVRYWHFNNMHIMCEILENDIQVPWAWMENKTHVNRLPIHIVWTISLYLHGWSSSSSA